MGNEWCARRHLSQLVSNDLSPYLGKFDLFEGGLFQTFLRARLENLLQTLLTNFCIDRYGHFGSIGISLCLKADVFLQEHLKFTGWWKERETHR